MRRFHESRIVLQLSWKKQGVILTVTSRKEEHHGLVSGAVDRGKQRVVNEERCCHPNLRIREKMLVLWLLHTGLTRQQAAKAAGVSRATVQRYVAAFRQGGLDGLRQWNLSRPVSEMAAYRELIAPPREATSHDHRRGVRTHLSTDRVAPRAQPGAQVPQGSGPEVLPGPSSPCRQKKTWPSTLRPSRSSRNRTEATLGRRPSR